MTFLAGRAAIVLLSAGVIACGQRPAPSQSAAATAAPVRPAAPAPKASAPAVKPPASSAPVAPKAKPAAAAPVDATPARGILHIDSDVPSAQVFIDRQYIGVTPLTAPDIPPGTHRVNVSAPGYNGIAESVDVEPGPRDLLFSFKEVRLDAAIDVVHKHRIGSCSGRLIATPQGIRYETTDKNDAFTSPLASLDRFEVDYLAKTLHVTPSRGKQYDFTDPEGNADRLFVFHRDVDAARKKLRGAA